jgi:hypothetical protein
VVCSYLTAQNDGGSLEWQKLIPQLGFDHVFYSLFTLLEFSTTEGWVDAMYVGDDVQGIDMHPKYHAGVWMSHIFYFLFIILASFFVINLFVMTVCDSFSEMKEKLGGGSVLMTKSQKEWVKVTRMLNKLKPYRKSRPPAAEWRRTWYNLVRKPAFENFIMGCILVNTVVMCLRKAGMSPDYSMGLEVANYIFAAIFTIEMVLKLIGLGSKAYFNDSWNVFDFVVVWGTILGIVIKFTLNLPINKVVAALRVMRVVRLLQTMDSLKAILYTLIVTVPQLFNIGLLLFLCDFIFGVLGVQLFANLRMAEVDDADPHQLISGNIDVHANFKTFGVAFLTLFRSGTGENYNGMMYGMMITEGDGTGCQNADKWGLKRLTSGINTDGDATGYGGDASFGGTGENQGLKFGYPRGYVEKYGRIPPNKALIAAGWGGGVYPTSTYADGETVNWLNPADLINSTFALDKSSTWDPRMCDMEASDPERCMALLSCSTSPVLAYCYFTTFTIITCFVMLNLFVAVLIDTFQEQKDAQQNDVLSDDKIDAFSKIWTKYDPDATEMMPVSRLHHFFADLPAPMGFNTTGESTAQIVNRRTPAASFNEMREQVTKLAQRIKTFQDGGTAMVYFNDVAKECALHSFVEQKADGEDGEEGNKLMDEIEKMNERNKEKEDAAEKKRRDSTKSTSSISSLLSRKSSTRERVASAPAATHFTVNHIFAAMTIAGAYRTHQFRERMKRNINLKQDEAGQ